MSTIVMDKKDELIMKLVHYFVTEENYNPIIVNGVKDEIWLENAQGPYRIVRINSNNIFNNEQLEYDFFKIENIVNQIKKKTLSFKVDTLDILLNVNEDLKVEGTKHIATAPIFNNDPVIKNEEILSAFPDINEKLLKDQDGIDLIINVTKDINNKTSSENKAYEKTFKPKTLFITPAIMTLCVAMFVYEVIRFGVGSLSSVGTLNLLSIGGNCLPYLQSGQVWRLISYMFLHGSLIHLLCNMYSLFVIGNQMETFLGKAKYIFVYLCSGIVGGLLSAFFNPNVVSVGASGAIFGLMGSMLYFGYHYRTYLGSAIKSQILPIIILNLFIGFTTPGIDNACHIGGLIGGLLATMAVGVSDNGKKDERIGGIICLLAVIGILVYMVFFK